MELGSNFELDVNDLYFKPNNVMDYMSGYETVWFDYGRSAIKSIKIPQGKKILLPEFICESVVDCFPVDDIVFYKVQFDFCIDFDDLFSKINKNIGVIYVCHYFGYLQDKEKMQLCKKMADEYGFIMIEDITQSLFSVCEIIGDIAVASLRKWLPTPQGAVLCMNKGDMKRKKVRIPREVSSNNASVVGMLLKKLYLNKQYDTNRMYRDIFTYCEEQVDRQDEIYGMSEFAGFLMKCVNTKTIIKKRKENANQLKHYLDCKGIGMRAFSKTECPLVYPIRVTDRDKFRRYLMTNNIYCAVHWPFDGCQPDDRKMARKNAEELISLPIDQRYGSEEIAYLCEIIDKYEAKLQ